MYVSKIVFECGLLALQYGFDLNHCGSNDFGSCKDIYDLVKNVSNDHANDNCVVAFVMCEFAFVCFCIFQFVC